jgi:hypothetical protein
VVGQAAHSANQVCLLKQGNNGLQLAGLHTQVVHWTGCSCGVLPACPSALLLLPILEWVMMSWAAYKDKPEHQSEPYIITITIIMSLHAHMLVHSWHACTCSSMKHSIISIVKPSQFTMNKRLLLR